MPEETTKQKIARLKKQADDAQNRGDHLHAAQTDAVVRELERRLREEGEE